MLLTFTIGFAGISPATHAQTTSAYTAPEFASKAHEQRYHRLTRTVQCPNCEGSPVTSSPSPFAMAISAEIARRIKAGESDAEIRAFLIERYGPSIVSDPPLAGSTLLLYIAAALVLFGMVLLILRILMRLRQ